tara:strand:- start:148 stop:900 length:753 start_codon:yes stop_codon:yes gene_type:complete
MVTNTDLTADIRFSIIPEWVLDSDISDKALRVYALLARYADNDNLQAFPSRQTLANRARCSVKSIDRALDELIKLGAIKKQHRVQQGVYTSSLFTVIRVGVGTRVTLGGDTGDARVGTQVTHRTITNELELIKDNGFTNFWVIYPKKADKRSAQKAFAKALAYASVEDLLSGAEKYRDDPNRDPKYTKNASTWLNAGSWDNEPIATSTKLNEFGRPFAKPAEVPDPRAWVKAEHDRGEHYECRPGEFGCK